MTIDERLDRLEHVTAGWIDQTRREHEEDRQLWRETERQLLALSRTVISQSEHLLKFQEESAAQTAAIRAEMAERDRETDERFRETDKRIEDLVSAIGAFIRKSDAK